MDAIEEYFERYFKVLTFIQDELCEIIPGLSPADIWPEHKLQADMLTVAQDLTHLFEIANRLEEEFGIVIRDNELASLFDSPIDRLIEFVLDKLGLPAPLQAA